MIAGTIPAVNTDSRGKLNKQTPYLKGNQKRRDCWWMVATEIRSRKSEIRKKTVLGLFVHRKFLLIKGGLRGSFSSVMSVVSGSYSRPD
jgi:hypothetical protein